MELKTKFNLGDTVWCLFNSKAVKFEVKKVIVSKSTNETFNFVMYGADEISGRLEIDEKDAFGSKEELMQSVFGEEPND